MGWLKKIFKVIDPILDKIDPLHNKVQAWTTGQSTTEGQAPYFEKIAPVIIDIFLPGVGSAVGSVDAASSGNYKGAVIYAASAYAQGLGAGTSSTANTASGYSAGDLGTGITANTSNGVGVGLANSGASSATGAGISGTVNSGFSFGAGVSGAATSGAASISNATVIGFDNTDLGTGIMGISYDNAQKVGAQPLTAGAVRAGIKYAKYGVDLYNMRTASGDVLATFGAPVVNISPVMYQFGAPTDLSAIPTNRAADLQGAAIAQAKAQEAEQRQKQLVIAVGAAALVYFISKGKK